ncbi:MAG: M10 family metallopeptidase domain-containing protein, partial [Acidimicrobiales bacterium]|nr:M10 family metallopeptidase domain-containing protein [Acidimicrobiales bacterium]
GPALWPQCERVDVHISIDPSIDSSLRASARSLAVNTILELNKLTGLTLVVRSGATEQAEEFFDPGTDPAVPGIRELDVFWYNTASDAPSERFGIADAWHSGPDTSEQPAADGSVNLTSKDAPTQQASLLRSRIHLSIEILRRLPDAKITEPSQAMAVLHELAHVVGIGHSTARDSFMYPRFNHQTRLTTPDRAAHALAGSRPC